MTTLPRIALVGRPNVGKSTLFNRLLHQRIAVVSDIAGTTRDRLEQQVSVAGQPAWLVDMAGIEPSLSEHSEITEGMQRQVTQALRTADVLVWVVDSQTGITPTDDQIAVILRGQHKPVVIAMNKCDHPNHDLVQYEAAKYGFEETCAISAVHGRGIDLLWEAIGRYLPEHGIEDEPAEEPQPDDELRLALVGRPNVGKSTLLNALVQEERSLVSPVAGTTRDSVDSIIPSEDIFFRTYTKWKTIRIVDTAGIRRRGKIDRSIEGWSVLRTLDSIDRAEAVILLLDAEEGLVHQDLQVAQQIVDAGRALVIMVNKWDLRLAKAGAFPGTKQDAAEQETYLHDLRTQMPFLHWVQVLFISALEGINLAVIGQVVLRSYVAWSRVIPQAELDDFAASLKNHPTFKNLISVTEQHAQPPVFHITVEGKGLPHFSSIRMFENSLREWFELGPAPIKVWVVPSVERAYKKRG